MLLWDVESKPVCAQALWFGESKPTVNTAELAALEWGLERLLQLGAAGKILVLGDSKLVLDFCTCRA